MSMPARRLCEGDYDKWGAAGDLAFLIHFDRRRSSTAVYDDDADRGRTYQQVNDAPAEGNLHYAWHDTVVSRIKWQEPRSGALRRSQPNTSKVRQLSLRFRLEGTARKRRKARQRRPTRVPLADEELTARLQQKATRHYVPTIPSAIRRLPVEELPDSREAIRPVANQRSAVSIDCHL
jgi:hypothetical protein